MIRGLDGFRALALLAVFYFDVFDGFGYLGVPAFFVLSGFLITSILARMKLSRSTRDYFLDFYGRRSIRIFPLYFVYLALLAFLWSMFGDERDVHSVVHEQLPWALTYTLNFAPGARNGWHGAESARFLGHLWSLSVEEQFYLFWPLFIFLVPLSRLKHALLGVMALGPVLRLGEYLLIRNSGSSWTDQWDLAIYVLTFSHIDAFATGGFFALYADEQRYSWKWIAALAAATFGVGYLSEYLATGQLFVGAAGFAPYMKDSGKFVWGYSALNVLVACTLVAIRRGAFFPRVFENLWLRRLGRISYGLYVYDAPVLWLVRQHFTHSSRLVHALIAFPISIAISSLSFYLLESPLLALKDRYFDNTRVAPRLSQAPGA